MLRSFRREVKAFLESSTTISMETPIDIRPFFSVLNIHVWTERTRAQARFVHGIARRINMPINQQSTRNNKNFCDFKLYHLTVLQ